MTTARTPEVTPTTLRLESDCAVIVSFVFQILGALLAVEMQFDRGCPLFLHRCHHILLLLGLISAPDAFGELGRLLHSACFGYNSQTTFPAQAMVLAEI